MKLKGIKTSATGTHEDHCVRCAIGGQRTESHLGNSLYYFSTLSLVLHSVGYCILPSAGFGFALFFSR